MHLDPKPPKDWDPIEKAKFNREFYDRRDKYDSAATSRACGTALIVFATLALTVAWAVGSIYTAATYHTNKLLLSAAVVSATCGPIMGVVLATLGGIQYNKKTWELWGKLDRLNQDLTDDFISRRSQPIQSNSHINDT